MKKSKKTYPKISKYDFTFIFSGHGHYKVIYTSPTTLKMWSAVTNNMTLIDATKNTEYPKRKDLEALKWIVKYISTK